MRKGRRVARLPPPLPPVSRYFRRASSDVFRPTQPSLRRRSIDFLFFFSLSVGSPLFFSLPLCLSRRERNRHRSVRSALGRRSFFIRRYDLSPGVNGRLDQPCELSFSFFFLLLLLSYRNRFFEADQGTRMVRIYIPRNTKIRKSTIFVRFLLKKKK